MAIFFFSQWVKLPLGILTSHFRVLRWLSFTLLGIQFPASLPEMLKMMAQVCGHIPHPLDTLMKFMVPDFKLAQSLSREWTWGCISLCMSFWHSAFRISKQMKILKFLLLWGNFWKSMHSYISLWKWHWNCSVEYIINTMSLYNNIYEIMYERKDESNSL